MAVGGSWVPGGRNLPGKILSAGSLARNSIGLRDPALALIAVEEGWRACGGARIRLTMVKSLGFLRPPAGWVDATHTSTHRSELGWACRGPPSLP
jgi:hypothetical protein